MKKKLLVVLSFVLIGIMWSCSDSTESSETGLVGSWSLKSIDIDIETMSDVFGQTLVDEIIIVGEDLAYDLTFADDGNWNTTGDYDFNVTVISNGNDPQQINVPNRNEMQEGTYTNTATKIFADRLFYNLEVNGINYSEVTESFEADYVIQTNGDLKLTDAIDTTIVSQGLSTRLLANSISVWERK